VTPFQPPPWTIGTGLTFKTSASAVAGRNHRFSCPAKVSLGARYAVSSLQPNDATRWRRQWDDASSMHFAIRDAHALLSDGMTAKDAAAATSRKLTAAQRRFLVHALHQLSDLSDTATDDAKVGLSLEANVEYSGSWGEITVFGAHLVSDDSYDELHDFAARLGLARRVFQDDHYDVPADVREKAIGLGAQPVAARELLARLKAAGLRRKRATRL